MSYLSLCAIDNNRFKRFGGYDDQTIKIIM